MKNCAHYAKLMAGFLLLSGCSLLPETGNAPDRFLLDPVNFQNSARPSKLSRALVMDQPVMYAPLDNTRVGIKPTPHTIDYLADIEWGDRLETLIYESTLQSLQNAHIFKSAGRLNGGQQAHYLMAMDVRKFNKTESCNGAEVEYFVQIFDMEKRQGIISKLFYHCAELPKNATAQDVALTLNTAHGIVVSEMIAWLGRSLS